MAVGFLIIMLIVAFIVYFGNQKYSYEWIEVKESSIGQYRLYVNNQFGQHVNGTVRIVYINGKSKRVNVDKTGLLYVKSVVADVRNPNKR